MSSLAVGYVFNASEESGNSLLVLLAIAEAVDDEDGAATISYREIARKARCSDSTAIRHVKRLVESGELIAEGQDAYSGKNIWIIKGVRTLLLSLCQKQNDTKEFSPHTPLSENSLLNHEIETVESTEVQQTLSFTSPPYSPPSPDGSPDYEAVMKEWNEFASSVGLPKIIQLTDTRKKWIKAKHEILRPRMQEIFEIVRRSPFLLGKNERGWRLSFDALWERSNVWPRILEGFYDTKGKGFATDTEKYRTLLRSEVESDPRTRGIFGSGDAGQDDRPERFRGVREGNRT